MKYLAEKIFFGCLAISIVAKIYLSVLFTNCAALFHLVKLPVNEACELLLPAFSQFHPMEERRAYFPNPYSFLFADDSLTRLPAV